MTTKLSWAVTAGDQIGDSEDDQPCGNHFIDNDLECHDGDAHRPTPGKNPYWQGGREGPEDKSATPERKEGEKNQQGHKRDRFERTKQNLHRYMTLLDTGHSPESLGREEVNHFADMWEENKGRQIDDQGIHDLAEMINQKVAERGSYDAQEMGYHDPTAPQGQQGTPGRQLWKQGSGPNTRETEMPRGGGGMEHTPDSSGGGEDGGLYDLYKDILKGRSGGGDGPGFRGGAGGGEDDDYDAYEETYHEDRMDEMYEQTGPSRQMEEHQDKWDAPDYQGTEDAGPEPKSEKGEPGPYEYQDRHVDEWDPDATPEETKDYQKKERRRQTSKDYKRKRDAGKAKVPKATKKKKAAPKKKAAKKKAAKKKVAKKKANSSLASQLIWANPIDVAEGRPCGDGEDPKKGKCNDGLAPPPKQQPADPGYNRVSDKIKGPRQEGIGLEPSQDAGREARMAQHVDFLSQDNGMDTKQTTNLMVKMLGGKPVSQPDGTTMVGSKPVATPQEAKQQNDDYRDTLTKTGWETYSEMGNTSVYKKGNTAIVLEKKPNGNQMKIKNLRPPAAPQRGRR